MRAHHEGRVPGKHDTAEHEPRRFKIENRLKERGSTNKDSAICGGNCRSASVLTRAMTSARMSGGGMPAGVTRAGCIGAHRRQRLRIGRPIPDDVVTAPAYRGIVVASGHRIADQLLALRQADRVEVENLAPDRRRHLRFVEHPAPGDIAGIERLRLRQELLAYRGAYAVGADQQFAAFARAIGKDGGDARPDPVRSAAALCRGDSLAPATRRVARGRVSPSRS